MKKLLLVSTFNYVKLMMIAHLLISLKNKKKAIVCYLLNKNCSFKNSLRISFITNNKNRLNRTERDLFDLFNIILIIIIIIRI